MSIDPDAVRRGLDRVRDRIAGAGGDPEAVTIVAVTKGFGPEAVTAAVAAGAEHLGENYAQELVAKAERAGEGVQWHFIGGLQRNKVRGLAPLVDLWETVDRAPLGAEIARRAPGAAVLVQVNISEEATKGGCRPEAAPDLVAELRELGLEVRGVMGIAAPGDQERARRQFGALADLSTALDLAERSMGMSEDLEVAVAQGATIVRVGTALFGSRPPR